MEFSRVLFRSLPILEATRSGVSQWTATSLVDFWCRRLLGYLPARRNVLVDFMRQNGAAGDVIADSDSWAGNDLKRHYNQQRLRSMVSLVLMSPEFQIGRASCRERVCQYV